MLLVQNIKVIWYKDCRGGKGADLRSKMSKAAMLPANFFDNSSDKIFHFLCLSQDKQGFHNIRESKTILKGNEYRLCPAEIFMESDDKYRVNYHDRWYGAFPHRYQYDATGTYTRLNEEAFTLNMGDYGRVICNGRFVDIDTGEWWYEMEIINIRVIPKNLAHLNCFLAKKPTYIYKQLAMLW